MKRFYELMNAVQKGSVFGRKDLIKMRDELEKYKLSFEKKEIWESVALADLHIFVIDLRTKKISISEAEQRYDQIRADFFKEEKRNRDNLPKTEKEKRLWNSQMLYFYKMAEIYMAYLAQELKEHNLGELVTRVRGDELNFLRQQKLLEGDISRFLGYTHVLFMIFMRKYAFLYGFLVLAAVVLIWQGLWGLYDKILEYFGVYELWYPFVVNVLVGVFVLYVLGVFMEQSVGTNNVWGDISSEDIEGDVELGKIERKIQK